MSTIGAFVIALVCVQETITSTPARGRTDPAEQDDGSHVEFYDVRDLALPVRMRALAPDGSAAPAGEPSDTRLSSLRALGYAAGPDDGVRATLVAWRLLEALLQCTFSASDPSFSCSAQPSGALVVRAAPAVHERIRRLLDELRRPDPAIVTVEIQGLELDAKQRALLAELESPEADDDDELAVARIQHVSRETIDRLKAIRLGLPQITTFPLEPFDLRVGNECAYIEKFDLVSIEGIGRIADPVVKTVFEGLSIQGRVVAAPGFDGKETPFALRLEIQSSLLKRPVQTLKTDAGEIQLPELKHATIATTVAGSVRHNFLVGGVPKPTFDREDEGLRLYFLVTVGAPVAAPAPRPPPPAGK